MESPPFSIKYIPRLVIEDTGIQESTKVVLHSNLNLDFTEEENEFLHIFFENIPFDLE